MQTDNQNETTMVAGVVVLYYPSEKVVENINSYINQVNWLFIIDNSETNDEKIVKKLSEFQNASYHTKSINQGIATALNWGALLALEKNYELLLTMDQDTSLPDNIVQFFVKFWEKDKQHIGIISPVHLIKHKHLTNNSFEQADYVMTSGNLLSLSAYRKVGGFMDSLFIDHVDHEYCMRLRKNNFAIYTNNNFLITHNLGYTVTKNFIFFKVSVHGHSPIRLYYMIRNGFHVAGQYPSEKKFKRLVQKTLFYELIKSIIFYNEKLESIVAIIRGVRHYKKGRFGPYTLK